ncbi:MAG: PHP domain-containing protein [Nitriliruptoraceae bacterium]
MPGFDLHTHSTLSDGTTTIEQNVADAVALGLDGLGVTDHDTTAGFEQALAAADGTALEIVPGTEFSAELDGWSVHVLGYWVAPDDGPLVAELARLRDERTDRARRIVSRFNELGIEITFERVAKIAGAAPIGRPHIAQAVVESGAVTSAREVFDRYLADGGPANVEKHAVHPVRAVELLVAAGGVAVLAHPGLYGARDGVGGIDDVVIDELAAAGLAGIEADHPDHDETQCQHYRQLAAGLGLVVTAGSDYHGEAKTNLLGSATTDREQVEALRSRRT